MRDKERLEEIKVVENWDNLNEWQFKEVAYLINQVERMQEFDCIHCNGKGFNGLVPCTHCVRGEIFRDNLKLEQQNKRYRELLESIRYTQDIAQEIQAEKPNIKVITPDDLLQQILRKVNKELESELE